METFLTVLSNIMLQCVAYKLQSENHLTPRPSVTLLQGLQLRQGSI